LSLHRCSQPLGSIKLKLRLKMKEKFLSCWVNKNFSQKKAPQPTQSWEKNNWKVFLVNSKKSKAVSIWKKEYQEAVISSWRIKNLILILGKNISRMKSPVKKFWTSTSYIEAQSCPNSGKWSSVSQISNLMRNRKVWLIWNNPLLIFR